jgi:gas vesicle protein
MSKKLLLGIIAGAAAGTLVGILIAPDKGAKTRKKAARNMRACVKKLKDTLSSLGDEQGDAGEIFEWEHAERPFTGHMMEYPV